MPKRDDLINAKLGQVESMADDLKNRDKVLVSFGQAPLSEKTAFQEARVDVLKWCQKASEEAIAARLDTITRRLGIGIFAKYGSVRGLPDSVVKDVCEAELLELALGTHPALHPNG